MESFVPVCAIMIKLLNKVVNRYFKPRPLKSQAKIKPEPHLPSGR